MAINEDFNESKECFDDELEDFDEEFDSELEDFDDVSENTESSPAPVNENDAFEEFDESKADTEESLDEELEEFEESSGSGKDAFEQADDSPVQQNSLESTSSDSSGGNAALSAFEAIVEDASEDFVSESEESYFTGNFAEALPEWDLVPPNIIVRRRR